MPERALVLRLSVVDIATPAINNYNNALKNAAAQNQQMTSSLTGVNQGFTNLTSAMHATVLGISAMKIFELAADMNELGQRVTIAERTFTALAGGADEAGRMLQAMRESTGGVIDDLSLMAGASRLMQMGLADSVDEVAGLTEMATKLGMALGMDANKAIEDFSLLLSNVSYLRLDQFGIAAGAVRARVQELAAEFPNMSREARFAQAVLEEGQDALERLGDAADASSTSFNRWGTRLKNVMQDASQNVNAGVEGILGFLEALDTHTSDVYERTYENPTAEAINERLMGAHGLMMDPAAMPSADNIRNVTRAIQELTSAGVDFNEMTAEQVRMHMQGENLLPILESPQQIQTVLDLYAGAQEDIIRNQDELNTLLMRQAQSEQIATRYAQERAAALAEANRAAIMGGTSQMMEGDFVQAMMGMGMSDANRALMRDQYNMGAFSNESQYLMENMTAPDFLNPANAEQVADAYQDAQLRLAQMRDLAAEFPDLITDEQIQHQETAVDMMGTMADQAQRAADNYASMADSIKDLTGQGSGGAAGEISDLVATQLQAQGIDTTKFEDQTALFTGEDTLINRALQGEGVDVLADVYNQYGQDAYEIALQNMIEGIQEARASGMSEEEIAAQLPNMTGFLPGSVLPNMAGGMESSIPAIGGHENILLNPEAAAAFDPSEFISSLTEAEAPLSGLADHMTTSAEQAGMFESSMTLATQPVNRIRTEVDAIADRVSWLSTNKHKVLLEPEIDETKMFLQLSRMFSMFEMKGR